MTQTNQPGSTNPSQKPGQPQQAAHNKPQPGQQPSDKNQDDKSKQHS